MPAPPRWLLAVPDAIRQLEALDRDLLTRRDVERLFGVSRARAAQLMRTFGAELVGASHVTAGHSAYVRVEVPEPEPEPVPADKPPILSPPGAPWRSLPTRPRKSTGRPTSSS